GRPPEDADETEPHQALPGPREGVAVESAGLGERREPRGAQVETGDPGPDRFFALTQVARLADQEPGPPLLIPVGEDSEWHRLGRRRTHWSPRHLARIRGGFSRNGARSRFVVST